MDEPTGSIRQSMISPLSTLTGSMLTYTPWPEKDESGHTAVAL